MANAIARGDFTNFILGKAFSKTDIASLMIDFGKISFNETTYPNDQRALPFESSKLTS